MRGPLIITSALIASIALTPTASLAQDEGYAWGDETENTQAPPTRDDPARVMAWLGAGVGFRLVQNLDFSQSFMSPAYLDLGAAYFFEGTDIRHGVGGTVSTNLTAGEQNQLAALAQWVIAPAYHLDIPFRRLMGWDHDWFHLQGRFAVPLVLGAQFGGGSAVDFSVGLELGVTGIFKFLAGLGVYVDAQIGVYGGADETVHPIITVDGGLLWDYELW